MSDRSSPAIGALVVALFAACTTTTTDAWREATRAPGEGAVPPGAEADDLLAGPTLGRARFVRAVLARNPGLEAGRAALHGALAEVPRVTALDDPQLSYSIAPGSLGHPDVEAGHSVELRQMLPFPGTLGLRGEVARARAASVGADLGELRLELAREASQLYDDAFELAHARGVNDEHRRLVEQAKASASAAYTAGRATQDDPLQADLELAVLEEERLALEARATVVVGRMTRLLHRRPEASLPPVPAERAARTVAPLPTEELQAQALARRPALAGARAGVGAADASVALAAQENLPKLGVMASYSTMWMDPAHRAMVGVSLDLPVWRERRSASIDVAEAERARAGGELRSLEDELRAEADAARAELVEAQAQLEVIEARAVPSARARVAAATAGYAAGQTAFLSLMDATRGLRSVELRRVRAIAEVARREGALARAVGRVAGDAAEGGGR